jgi:hypothetical protein
VVPPLTQAQRASLGARPRGRSKATKLAQQQWDARYHALVAQNAAQAHAAAAAAGGGAAGGGAAPTSAAQQQALAAAAAQAHAQGLAPPGAQLGGKEYDAAGRKRGTLTMLLCRVALGQIMRGQSGIRRPDDGFHSAASGTVGFVPLSRGDICAVYENSAAYPCWRITYEYE